MLSRRNFLCLGAAAVAELARAAPPADGGSDLHLQILEEAGRQETRRRARFAAVTRSAEIAVLQKELRDKFLNLLDGLPSPGGQTPGPPVGLLVVDRAVVFDHWSQRLLLIAHVPPGRYDDGVSALE